MSATTTTSLPTRKPELHDGTLTTWQPLTSAWPSSTGCENSLWQVVVPTIAAWDPGYGIYVQPGLACLPPQATSWWDAFHLSLFDLSKTQISIGPIVCPEAYTTAFTSTNAGGSTFVACCPSSYKFAGEYPVGNTGECLSQVNDGEEIQFMTNLNGSLSGSWMTTSAKVIGAYQVVGIPVNGWLFPNSASSSSSSSSRSSSGSGSSSSPSSAQPENSVPSSSNSAASSSSGLSAGAKAGIGIGVSLGVIAIGAIVAVALIRRRRTRANAGAPGQSKPGVSEMQGSPNYASELP